MYIATMAPLAPNGIVVRQAHFLLFLATGGAFAFLHQPPTHTARPNNGGDQSSALAAGSADDMPLPFFASPASDQSLSAGSEPVAGSTTVTTRLPLGTLFDSRDYIFNAATNVRGYEWTLKETDELFDDLSDVSIGEESPNKHRGDYELSQIVLVPSQWDRAQLGLGARYDVHDGQQRLVTLSLLFAALRESFRGDDDHDETVEELTLMLNPRKVRKAPVLRIELRKRDNEMLQRILEPDIAEDSEGNLVLNVPPQEEYKGLSLTNERVLTNYNHLASRISELTSQQRLALLDYCIEHVYLLACVPETATIARNIVMAQGKGMDTEPIDDFKGLVCFRYTSDESNMYDAFDKWDILAAQPDTEMGSVGRETVAAACLLRASAALQMKIRKNDEALALETWLRQELIQNGYEGKDFFTSHVDPASKVLRTFREGTFDSFDFTSRGGKADAMVLKSITRRLSFLRTLTSSVSSAKEAEILILDLLLKAEGDGKKAIALDELDLCLASVESCAIWMAVMRPSPVQRHKRAFDILEIVDSGVLLDDMTEVVISEDEKKALKDELLHYDFGASPAGKKLAIALLQRINVQLLAEDDKDESVISPCNHIEHVLPTNTYRKYWSEQWPDEEITNLWTHRLGNLVLMSRKSTAKESNNVFGEKKERYRKEAAPLTQHISEIDTWNKYAVSANHDKLVGLIGSTWQLWN